MMLRQKLSDLLPANGFIRGVVALAGGTIGAQAVLIVVSPLLTRLYTPEMFGVMAVFVGFTTILGTLATWRYELAIPQTEGDNAAANITLLCLCLSVAIFLSMSAAILFLRGQIVSLFGLQEIAGLLWLVPAYIFIIGFSQALTYWSYRKRQFGVVAQSTISRNAGMVGLQLALFPLGATALVLGKVFGQVIFAGMLALRSLDLLKERFSLAGLRGNASHFRKYPIFSTWSGVTGSAAQQAPMLMFAALFSPTQAGLYSLAFRMVSLPGTLIGTAVANVFLPHASDAHRSGDLGALLVRVHNVLVPLAIPVVTVLLLLSPDIFSFVFGAEWREAGHYAQWLSVMLYANFVFSPVSTAFGIMNKQDVGLMLFVALLIVSVISIWVGAIFYQSTLASVAIYSVANTLLYVWALIWLHRKVGGTIIALLKPLVVSFVRALPMIMPLSVLSYFSVSVWWAVVLAIATVALAVVYYLPFLKQLREGGALRDLREERKETFS